jgi:amidohydrolase
MIDNKTIRAIKGIYPYAVKIRRTLHARPELSGREHQTAFLVAAELRKMGLKPRFYLHKTAVVCRIDRDSGTTVALRADMDALPVEEKTGLPFASRNPGIMHACGHDLHTAILLGAARVLTQSRTQWRGSVILLFQPSEEMEPGGALGLINAGAFPADATAVFGLHVNPELRTGAIGLREGSDFAGVLNFSVTIHGHGGHAAAAQVIANPITCVAEMISLLSKLAGQKKREGAVIAVGVVHAGSRSNIIPDRAEFCGTIRFHSKSVGRIIRKEVNGLITSAAKSRGLKAAIEFSASYPPNWNDPSLTGRMRTYYRRLIAPGKVVERRAPVYYAEDFAYYQEKVPGLYVHLGVLPAHAARPATLHNAHFSPDENAMKTGMLAHVAFVDALCGVP